MQKWESTQSVNDHNSMKCVRLGLNTTGCEPWLKLGTQGSLLQVSWATGNNRCMPQQNRRRGILAVPRSPKKPQPVCVSSPIGLNCLASLDGLDLFSWQITSWKSWTSGSPFHATSQVSRFGEFLELKKHRCLDGVDDQVLVGQHFSRNSMVKLCINSRTAETHICGEAKKGVWVKFLLSYHTTKKQDEAHEPECRHVCWQTETILICHISSKLTCETPWVHTLRWHSCRTPLLDTLAQRAGETLLLDTLVRDSYVTFL